MKKSRNARKRESTVNKATLGIDNPLPDQVESGLNQPTKGTDMNTFVNDEGYTETINPLPTHEPTKQEIAAEKAAAKIVAKAEKAVARAAAAAEKAAAKLAAQEAREAAKAEKAAAKLAAIQAKNAHTKEEREAAKAERAARLAALDPDGTRKYVGPMLALADRVKQGAYVKGATGQLRSTNELAEMLDAVPVANVIQLAKIVLGLPNNPYTHLNSGQQSMNLRNKMRGAIKAGKLTLEAIQVCIDENGFATATDWPAQQAAKAEAKAARAAARAADRAAKEAIRVEKAAARAEAKLAAQAELDLA